MALFLLIVLVLLIIGGVPRWPYSRSWGYGPSGTLSVLLMVVIALMIFGYVPRGF